MYQTTLEVVDYASLVNQLKESRPESSSKDKPESKSKSDDHFDEIHEKVENIKRLTENLFDKCNR